VRRVLSASLISVGGVRITAKVEVRVGRVGTARRWARHGGIRPVAEVAGSWFATRIAPEWIHRNSVPTLRDFTTLSAPIATSGAVLLERLGWPANDVGALAEEFGEVSERLVARYHATNLAFPQRFGVETETGFFLYAATRLLKPANVVETGVADGRSSFIFLSALERNNSGTLHSFDINPRAGGLVGRHERWRLRISDRNAPEATFAEALRQIGKVDLFFHDSDHRYLGQLLEYVAVWPLMTPGGLFASDDCDVSKAYIDFCTRRGRRPQFLFDNRKMTGALRT
jgi:predicted O-methyltransferase YrrM